MDADEDEVVYAVDIEIVIGYEGKYRIIQK
jgi:hypothetical protein